MKLSLETTNQHVINNMMARLGDRKQQDVRERCIFEMNRKIDELEMGPVYPWFLEKKVTLQATANSPYIDLPQDFIIEVEEDAPGMFDEGNFIHYLRKVIPEAIPGASASNGTSYYALTGTQLILAPIPVKPYTIEFRYYAESDEVVDDTNSVTNPWLKNAYNFITFASLEIVAQFVVRDAEGAARFAQDSARAWDALMRMHEARQHINADYSLGDD